MPADIRRRSTEVADDSFSECISIPIDEDSLVGYGRQLSSGRATPDQAAAVL
jgi:hypothetical protein